MSKAKAANSSKRIKVRATQRGYFGGVIRDPQDRRHRVFFIDSDDQFSHRWMKALDPADQSRLFKLSGGDEDDIDDEIDDDDPDNEDDSDIEDTGKVTGDTEVI